MTSKENRKYDFELNLNFDGGKNPSQAFGQLAKMYEKVYAIDQHILYNILPQAKIDYELTEIEFSSIKSKVVQIIKNVPDDFLKDILNPSAWLGHVLVFVKHRLLKAVEKNEVQSKLDLERLTSEINNKIKEARSSSNMIFEVNNYYVLNTINEIGTEGKRLKNSEFIEYKSQSGKARISNRSSVNMPKLLFELGDQQIEQKRIEILKIKSLDLLSDRTKWKLMRMGKAIDVKILHQEWLDKYHNREIVIQSGDYLKLELKITYTTSPGNLKPTVTYEALKILEVIPPGKIEDDGTVVLF
jgi:hypothetical protein